MLLVSTNNPASHALSLTGGHTRPGQWSPSETLQAGNSRAWLLLFVKLGVSGMTMRQMLVLVAPCLATDRSAPSAVASPLLTA